MTIKIKAPIIWLDDHDFEEHIHGDLGNRLTVNERKHRIVRESDWRKLMRLVKVVDEHDHADRSKTCDICEALVAFYRKEKKK